jgi:hypothetical protein
MAYPFHLQSQPNLDDIRSAVDSGCDLDNACARWLVDVSTDLLEACRDAYDALVPRFQSAPISPERPSFAMTAKRLAAAIVKAEGKEDT